MLKTQATQSLTARLCRAGPDGAAEIDHALAKAVNDSLEPETTRAAASWEAFHTACNAARVAPGDALKKTVIFKHLFDLGALKTLADASRGIAASCGGMEMRCVEFRDHTSHSDLFYNGHFAVWGDIERLGGGRGSEHCGHLSGRGVVHAASWSAAGQFGQTPVKGWSGLSREHYHSRFVGDIAFYEQGRLGTRRFRGEAVLQELCIWNLHRGVMRHPTGMLEDGQFEGGDFVAGTTQWTDGTIVIATACPGHRYGGEGIVRWADGVVHEGRIQARDGIPRAFILTEADFTTVYFSIDAAFKPDLRTRNTVYAAGRKRDASGATTTAASLLDS